MSRGHSRLEPRRYVLDANALIGFFENRPVVAAKVEHLLDRAKLQEAPLWISAVNWGEVFCLSWKLYGENHAREIETALAELPILVVATERERATRAAALKQKHNLGYADGFAAELAIERGAWLVTADPDFARVGKSLLLYSLPRYEK